jgi:hypothetical protein
MLTRGLFSQSSFHARTVFSSSIREDVWLAYLAGRGESRTAKSALTWPLISATFATRSSGPRNTRIGEVLQRDFDAILSCLSWLQKDTGPTCPGEFSM